ncbi:MAG: flavin reductase family protein [Planctomycetota bacterium]|nr:flavin reductase family protein [Planctomycetota bacterium]
MSPSPPSERVNDPLRAHALAAIGHLPRGVFVMTSTFNNKRSGRLVSSVQPVASDPLLICVACTKGHAIEPLIRDSQSFAICLIGASDRLVMRRFAPEFAGYAGEDPFDAFPFETLVTGAPVLTRSIAAIDCRVQRHLDIEADHELYIGHVVAGRVYVSSQESA